MIVAKWKSLIRHISNRHIDHDDALYNNCSHGELGKKKWIKVGMPVHINFIPANWPNLAIRTNFIPLPGNVPGVTRNS
jgi:hypothetical protein